jgi:ribosomal protein S27AE
MTHPVFNTHRTPHDELPLRMLGDNFVLQRHQWEELLDSLRVNSELAIRVAQMLQDRQPRPACPACGDPGFFNANTRTRMCGNARCDYTEALAA